MPTETTQEIKTKIRRQVDADADAGGLTAEHVYLLIAVVAGTVALAAWLVDIRDPGPNELLRGIFDVLRMVGVVAGCGYLVRAAESRVGRIHVRQAASGERRYQQGYAAGYVDGVARRQPEAAHLRSVN